MRVCNTGLIAKAKPNRVYQINLGLLKLFRKHYGNVYTKLGISSRRHLAAALDAS